MTNRPAPVRTGTRSLWARGPAALAAALLALITALGAAQVEADEVLVFAAASLTESLEAVADAYEQTSDDEVVVSFASSSTLARQIASGAPAEIYISANQKWMDYLEDQGLIRSRTRVDLLANRLVLVAPKTGPIDEVEIAPGMPLADRLGDGRLAMGNPAHVPAGIYGKQALKSLGAWESVAPKVARAADVRAALALVALGEAPLGIVYRTDAYAEDEVVIVGTFPERTHTPINYPVALTAQSDGPAAQPFYDYLISAEAAAIFKRYGFTPLD